MRTDVIKVECAGMQFPIKGGNGTFVILPISLYVEDMDTFKSACKSITEQIQHIMGNNKEIYGVLLLDEYNALLRRTFGKYLNANVYQYDMDNRIKKYCLKTLLRIFVKNVL